MQRSVGNTAVSLLALAGLILTAPSGQASDPAANGSVPSKRPGKTAELSKFLAARPHSPLEPSLQQAFLKALYRPERATHGAIHLDSPAQRLSADLTPSGLTLHTRAAGPSSAHLRLTALDISGHTYTLPAVTPGIEGERVSYRRGSVTEWYSNSPRGLEQGFTLNKRLEGASPTSELTLRLAVSGGLKPKLSADRKAVRLIGDGQNLLYRDLSACDARHQRLPSHIEVVGHEIRLVVDDRHATYPLTVDPLFEQQVLVSSDGQQGDLLGSSVAIKGDTAVVGAPGVNAAYVFTRSGGTWTQLAKLTQSSANYIEVFGYAVAISDSTIAVGAPGFVVGTQGAVFTYARNGGVPTFQSEIDAGAPGTSFGYSVAVDENALVATDGYGNAYFYTSGGGAWNFQNLLPITTSGWIHMPLTLSNGTLVVGITGQLADVFHWTGSGYFGGFDFDGSLSEISNNPTDYFGVSVAVDNTSGLIAVGATGYNALAGTVFTFPHPAGGMVVYPYSQITPADARSGDEFGISVAAQNGSLAVGAPDHDDGSGQNPGAVYTYTWSNFTWVQQHEMFRDPSSSGNAPDFGYSLAIDGNTLIAGEFNYYPAGAADVFLLNAPPMAVNDSYTMSPGTTLSVGAASGVLANDINYGTGTLSAQLMTTTLHGQLTFNADGSFSYTPYPGFLGADSFTYFATNDQGDSGLATVALSVQLATVLNVPNVTCDEGSSTTLKANLGTGAVFNPKHIVAGASLNFIVNGITVGSATTDNTGKATLAYTPSTPGILGLTVQFAGTSSYSASTGYGAVIVRNKTALNFNPDYATVGQGAIPSGYLTRTFDGQPLVGLTVTLSYDGKKVGTSTSDINGYVAFNVGNQYHAGTFNYQASYKGDGYNEPCNATATVTVTAAPTATTASNAAGAIGTSVLLKAKVIEQVGLTGLAGVPVTFSLNGNTVGTATTVKGGTATLSYSIAAGTPLGANQLTAQFAGNTDYNSSTSANATLTVSTNTTLTAANVTGSKGQSVTLSAQLLTAPGGSGVSGETLVFSVDGKSVGSAVTDGSGNASHSYTIPKSLLSGVHTIVVTHKAHAGYGSAAGSATLTVK